MARAKGFQGIVAFKKGSTWGTAVACGSGDGLYVDSCTFPEGGTELIENMQLGGTPHQRAPSLGDRKFNGAITLRLPYEGVEPLVAQVFGTAGSPSTVDTSGKQHAFKMNADLDGIFGTLAYEIIKDTLIYEAPSLKLTGLTLRGQANQNVMLELRGIASDFTDASSTNTTTSIDTTTIPANSQYLATFAHAAFWINAQSGTSLAGSDAVYITEFELTLDRALEGIVTTRFGNKIDEPHPTGFSKATLRVTFGHLQTGTGGNSTLVADQLAGTAKKAKLFLTSSVLAGAATQYFQHVLWFPYMVAMPADKPKLNSAGILTWGQTFSLHPVGTVPTGFTAGYTGAATWEAFNQRATDALA